MLVCLIHIVPIAVVNSYYNTNPTKTLCQCYQSHLHTLSNLGKNQLFHCIFVEWPVKIISMRDYIHIYCLFVCLVVFKATFNNISVISWRSVLLLEETGGPGKNHQHVASHWQTLSHNVVHLALIEIQTQVFSLYK
jgi:hypothetical protein